MRYESFVKIVKTIICLCISHFHKIKKKNMLVPINVFVFLISINNESEDQTALILPGGKISYINI